MQGVGQDHGSEVTVIPFHRTPSIPANIRIERQPAKRLLLPASKQASKQLMDAMHRGIMEGAVVMHDAYGPLRADLTGTGEQAAACPSKKPKPRPSNRSRGRDAGHSLLPRHATIKHRGT